jgi:undecaprenyl-diphosphatase
MWEYILLGIIQGLFEWIPVSSEGVLTLVSKFLVEDLNPLDLAIFLHLGTLLAVLVYFYKDWIDLILTKNKEFFKFFVIVTIISGAIGYVFYQISGNIIMGSGLLFLMGIGLFFTSFVQGNKINIGINKKYSAIIVGVLQGLSAIPGVSRSGSTIFGLSLFEKDPEMILKQSYLISVPVVLGSSLYLFIKNPVLVSEGWIALLFSFIFGLISLKFILDWAKKINFSMFTFVFGIICLIGAIISFYFKL